MSGTTNPRRDVMSPAARLVLFAGALVAALSLGLGLGAWLGPVPTTPPTPTHHDVP